MVGAKLTDLFARELVEENRRWGDVEECYVYSRSEWEKKKIGERESI